MGVQSLRCQINFFFNRYTIIILNNGCNYALSKFLSVEPTLTLVTFGYYGTITLEDISMVATLDNM